MRHLESARPERIAEPIEGAGAPHGRTLDPRTRARLFLFGAAILFGLAAVLVRVAVGGGMAGAQVTLVRFALGLAAVLVVFRLRPGSFRPVRHGLLASRGFLGGLAALLYYLALARTSAGEATMLNNTFPIWGVLLSLVLFDERPTFHLALALAVASAGVFLVLGGGEIALHLGAGEVIAIASGVVGGAAVTSIRALRATDNAFTIFFAFAVGGLLVSSPAAFGPWTASPAAWAAAAAVGLATFIAQLLMTEAYGALSVAEAALWQQLTPIASYLWGLTLGERIGVTTAIGVLLGLAGVTYGSLLGHAPRHAASRQAALARGVPAEEP